MNSQSKETSETTGSGKSLIQTDISRREMLRALGISGAAAASLSALGSRTAQGQVAIEPTGAGTLYIEAFPTSPFILSPFQDPLPIPAPLKPLTSAELYPGSTTRWPIMPQQFYQDCDQGFHEIWPNATAAGLKLPVPLIYDIKLQIGQHSFTSSRVQPIDSNGAPIRPPAGSPVVLAADGTTTLPPSTIYGFNGAFPGPMIYARYGQPSCVRFQNYLADNPLNLDRQNFGDPEMKFLTHLHNGHTAPESDGNPNHKESGYRASDTPGVCGGWCDNMYLNYPAGGDPNEKQSFFWFHDHTHGFTGANVYKGMVGLFPIYDPALDPGDELKGVRLPGVPKYIGNSASNGIDYNERIDYDIPLVLYDCRLDDGTTPHKDAHSGAGETHPEWWGKTFFKHLPNHGFVGDVFTVNGTAYPVLVVKRRRHRLRFLGASIARQYELSFMSSARGPKPAMATADANGITRTGDSLQGQWQLPDGHQCMVLTQVASEGGLLPFPIVRDKFEIWPAKRREFVIDFSKYMDGSPTTKGDVIWLVNTAKMVNGRKMNNATTTHNDNNVSIVDTAFDPTYQVPMMKIIIGDDAPDNSIDPLDYKALVNGKATLKGGGNPILKLRPMPARPKSFKGLVTRTFELQRSGTYGGEIEWLINGHAFDRTDPNGMFPQAIVNKGVPELWVIRNGGGGWTHPMHMHMEEHSVLSRNGVPTGSTGADSRHVDDVGKEDVVNLDPSEEVVIYRNFRTFTGRYVAHCHNLAHEDHAMMYGWEIV